MDSSSKAMIYDAAKKGAFHSSALMRPKREMSLKERGEQCKAMELSQKSFSMVSDVLGDINSIPIIGDFLGIFTAGASIVTHLTSGGLDIASTALDCADLPFDEIKEIMDKRFNEIDRKLDRNTAALEAVSRLVGQTLSAVEKTRQEMNVRFDEVLGSIEVSKVQPIISKITNFVQYFDEERERIRGLKQEDYVLKLQEPNSILIYLKDSRTPKGDSLHAPLFDIIKQNYAIPDDINDNIAFKALNALIYGTQTYISVMFFLLEQYAYLANYHYQRGDIDKYNEYFDYINNIFLDFKSSLIGSGTSKSEPLIDRVVEVLNTVKNKEFIRLQKDELVQDLRNRIDNFNDIKGEIDEMELPIIKETPENFVQISFKTDIKTPIGEWENGKDIRYAVQYQSKDLYSNVGDWSKPTTIRAKACPTIRIPVDQRRKTRLIFRKFDNDQPQLAGFLDPLETEFTDINRDLYNAAEMSDKDTGYSEAIIFINMKADINAEFEKGRRALHAAAYSGNAKLAMNFILSDKSTDINIKDKDGYTPLHIAADVGQAGFVNFLIDNNALVNVKTDPNLLTPLHLAARHGFVKTVKTLLKSADINLNEVDKGGFTPLHSAVLGGKNVVNVLISESSIDINPKSIKLLTPFHLVAINNDRPVAETLMKSNKVEINAGDSTNMTPLHYAAMMGNLDMVHYLMSLSEINVNAVTNKNNWSPLYYAIIFKKDDVALELLKSRNIDKDLKADGEITPLHFAVTFGRKKVVSELLKKRVNMEEKTKEGYTALHLAAMRKNPEILSMLIDGGSNIEATTINGSTPLHIAALSGKENTALTLLDKGADVKVSDNDGQAPIHAAAINDQLEVVRALIARDSTVMEMKNKNSETPLHVAAQKFNTVIVKDLWDKGADINTRNNEGIAPIHIFAMAGKVDMVKYLIDKGADLYNADNDGINFFYFAIRNDQLNVVQYAMGEKKFDWNSRDTKRTSGCLDRGKCIIQYFAVCDAIEYNKLDIVKYFVGTKKSIICKPLHTAARHGHLDIVKYLVEVMKMKVAGNNFTNNPNTPVCEASMGGHLEVVKYLVGKKADVNKKCFVWMTAVQLAVEWNHLDVLKFLAANKGNIRGKHTISGNSLLHIAAIRDCLEIAKYLIEEHNAKLNDLNNEHNTPLHIAAELGRLDMVKYFVEKGADISSTNNDEKTPLNLARNQDVVEYLQSKTGRFRRTVVSKEKQIKFLTNEDKYNNLALNSMSFIEIGNGNKRSASQEYEAAKINSNNVNFQNIDVIGTLLLLDVVIRYFTNQKYINTSNQPTSEAETQANALKITENFEALLTFFSNIPVGEQIDLAEVHANIYKAIKSGNNNRIAQIICSYVKAFTTLNSDEMEQLLSAFLTTDPSITLPKTPLPKGQSYDNLPHLLTQSCLRSDVNPKLLLI